MEIQPARSSYQYFTAIKKSQLRGIDFAVVEKLKAPIEKFNNNKELQEWASDKCNEIASCNYGGRKTDTYFQRREVLGEWVSDLKCDDSKTNTEKLLILNAITNNLKKNNDNYIPDMNKEVLNKSLQEIKIKLNNNKKYRFNFGDIYRKRLKEANIGDDFETVHAGGREGKWVYIPSRSEDRVNYKKNVKRLQTLSGQHWCTKAEHAPLYLKDCGFHIYLENADPKLIIKSEEGYIIEIEDELNSRKIPQEYWSTIKNYIAQKDLLLPEKVKVVFEQ